MKAAPAGRVFSRRFPAPSRPARILNSFCRAPNIIVPAAAATMAMSLTTARLPPGNAGATTASLSNLFRRAAKLDHTRRRHRRPLPHMKRGPAFDKRDALVMAGEARVVSESSRIFLPLQRRISLRLKRARESDSKPRAFRGELQAIDVCARSDEQRRAVFAPCDVAGWRTGLDAAQVFA